jgi:SAM-dependent methyltransferase
MDSDNIYARPDVVANYSLSRAVPERILSEYARNIVRIIGPDKHLLDAGFGTGTALLEFAKLTKTSGIDKSLAMHAFVRSKLKGTSIDVALIEDDLENVLSHLCEQADAVHVKAVMHIPEYPFLAMSALHAGIRPGGYFILGKEFSQPEDNLEQIGKYPRQDIILYKFYGEYFRFREDIGKPFVKPLIPAGDFSVAKQFLENIGYKELAQTTTSSWDKELTFQELIESIQKGTFTVHRKGLSDEDRSVLADHMKSYCRAKNYPLDYPRFYEASLNALIMQKQHQNL